MNALGLVRAGYRGGLLALAAITILSACANPFSRSTVSDSADPGRHCSDLVVKTLTSPVPVAGSYACLSADLQARLASYGSVDDKGLSSAMHDDSVTGYTYMGSTGDGGYVYTLTTKTAGDRVQLFWTDKTGHIIDLGYSSHP